MGEGIWRGSEAGVSDTVRMKFEQLEIDRLRREVAKLKAERDILKRPRPTSRGRST